MKSEGIHIRAVMFTAPDDDTMAMLQVQVMPLPAEIIKPLADYILEATNAWLTVRKIASGQMTKIPVVPPDSKVN